MVKIIMVEDDEMIGEIYKKQMEKSGFEVEIIDDSTKAAKRIVETEPDLVLMDLLMPGGGGIEILKQIHGWNGKTKKVIFSNEQESEKKMEATNLGADDFWIKSSFTPSQLIAEVKTLLKL